MWSCSALVSSYWWLLQTHRRRLICECATTRVNWLLLVVKIWAASPTTLFLLIQTFAQRFVAKLNCIEEDDTGSTTLNIVELYSCLRRKHCCKVSFREQVVVVVMIIIVVVVVGTYERESESLISRFMSRLLCRHNMRVEERERERAWSQVTSSTLVTNKDLTMALDSERVSGRSGEQEIVISTNSRKLTARGKRRTVWFRSLMLEVARFQILAKQQQLQQAEEL